MVTLWFLIALLIFFLMHLFRLQGKMPCINWPLTVSQSTGFVCVVFLRKNLQLLDESSPLFQEFFHYSVGTVLVLIASIVAAVKSGGVSALVAASVRKDSEHTHTRTHTDT